jgi:hypothetical protein
MVEKITNPSIVWQKCHDPLFEDAVEYTTPEDFVEEPSFTDDEDFDNKETIDGHIEKKIRVIVTPFGIMPYDQENSIFSILNLWLGHTNFNISLGVADIIEKTEGVETLDIFSRYRFRIGIGKLFISNEVMSNINKKVYNYLDKHG